MRPGDTFDQYQLVRQIGEGNMGVVWEAKDPSLDISIALKFLKVDWSTSPKSEARFRTEAQAVAQLTHPNIVRIFRTDTWKQQPFIALEYVDGASLDVVINTDRLAPVRVVEILKGVAAGLGHAHDRHIVHRDVKPGNVLVEKGGRVVLNDFGIAKRLEKPSLAGTACADIVGTPAYLSPEQAQGLPVSAASDIYSLGVLAWELIEGHAPFTGTNAWAVMLMHVNEPAPPLSQAWVPASLQQLVSSMLAKAPGDRPKDGNTVRAALAQAAAQVPREDAGRIIIDSANIGSSSTVVLEARGGSSLEDAELTAVCFELAGFSRKTCRELLPGRTSWLLEHWYGMVREAVAAAGGQVNRNVGDKVTALFGFPGYRPDHAACAVKAAAELQHKLGEFNETNDMHLEMRAGIACGIALAGHVTGDTSNFSANGELLGEMAYLSKRIVAKAPIRLNRAAYRRAAGLADYEEIADERFGAVFTTWGVPSGSARA